MASDSPASERPSSLKKKPVRGDTASASSNDTMYTASGAFNDDEIQQVQDQQLSPKSVSFMTMDHTPATSGTTSPAGERSQSQAELVRPSTESPKQPENRKRLSFKRSLNSLWKILDPPELAHNTGALHNIANQSEEESRQSRKKSASSGDLEREHTLLATISDKTYKQRV
ncbi:hypothetical protein DOTSEDRAFT_54083 [Dothistroma septosporum NZE10]|uniref:Uncharacterized protein n=1 Tax=Dothistroma septosporum (strain NZE10 / CBS 128990) TaxID=675120 RepID=M2XL11_DOTSN|nr:hypothetical protein DOTSEDRAFT_54083 [Dothistroma septosporum NZE10]